MGSSGNHFCVQWNNHQKNLLAVMSELLQTNALTDVTLGVDDGRSVECHKMILAACSTYFQTLFTQYPCKHPFVVLSGVKYPEIMRIVEFMYKGEVNVAQDELDAILKVAEALQVKGLIEANGWSPDTDVPPTTAAAAAAQSPQPPPPPPPPPAPTAPAAEKSKRNRRRKSSSPAHSTSRPYHVHADDDDDDDDRRGDDSPIVRLDALRQQIQQPTSWPLGIQAALPLGFPLVTRFAPQLETHRETSEAPAPPRNRKRKMSREHVVNRRGGTPILQTALKYGTPAEEPLGGDASPTGDESSANGAADLEQRREREQNGGGGASVDLSYRYPAALGSYCADVYGTNGDDETSALRHSLSEDSKLGIIGNYSPSQASELQGKRYKKYSRDDLTDAIQAVRDGMSANKAAVLFKVPSRTLYDKIKKLGYTNPKQRRSGGGGGGSGSSSACFPFGIGGNVDGSIYGNVADNSDASTETVTNVIDAVSRGESRDGSPDRETCRKSPSPRRDADRPRSPPLMPVSLLSVKQEPAPPPPPPPEDNDDDDVGNYGNNDGNNGNDNGGHDKAEDLSVSRKSAEVPVQLPPSIAINEQT